MLITLAVSGYRSLREMIVPLDRLNVVTGPNGSGKSSLYRAIRLLADVAQGQVVSALAREGGLTSTLWAGPERISRAMRSGEQPIQGTVRKDRVALKLGFASHDYGYAIDLGLPPAGGPSAFARDPEIKAESVWVGEALKRSNEFAGRNGPHVKVLEAQGQRKSVISNLAPFDSMMTHAADPGQTLELLVLRERMRNWRFYDHFRSDANAPARHPQVGTRTPVLASDGCDLPAALQTIREIGDQSGLLASIDDAFPGTTLHIEESNGLFEVRIAQRGLLRDLSASELSDGTLRYLLLVAALLSPRPPELLVLNEPETSLHPDLLPALARLIIAAAGNTQVIVVTHAAKLVEHLSTADACQILALKKELGETRVTDIDAPAWRWPKR
ncbi:MAG: AAA family ATPase [Hyphomicrobiaceae bacterium]